MGKTPWFDSGTEKLTLQKILIFSNFPVSPIKFKEMQEISMDFGVETTGQGALDKDFKSITSCFNLSCSNFTFIKNCSDYWSALWKDFGRLSSVRDKQQPRKLENQPHSKSYRKSWRFAVDYTWGLASTRNDSTVGKKEPVSVNNPSWQLRQPRGSANLPHHHDLLLERSRQVFFRVNHKKLPYGSVNSRKP